MRRATTSRSLLRPAAALARSATTNARGDTPAAASVAASSRGVASEMPTPEEGVGVKPPQGFGKTTQATAPPKAGAEGFRKPTIVVNRHNADVSASLPAMQGLFDIKENPEDVREAHKKYIDQKQPMAQRVRGWGTVACEMAPTLNTALFTVASSAGMIFYGFPSWALTAQVSASFVAIQRFFARGTPCPAEGMRDMNGKICVVTGASSGIGLQVAAKLLDRGATVIATHNTVSSEATKERILRKVLPDVRERLEGEKAAKLVVWPLRLDDRGSITRLANSIRKEYPNGVDVLVNNAGNMMGEDLEQSNGVERTIDVSFVGPYALTETLLAHVAKVDGRIVYLTNHAHRIVTTRDAPEKIVNRTIGYRYKDDTDMKYHRYRQFSYAKFGNVCHVHSLAARGVKAVAVNPGNANTELRRRVFPSLSSRWYWPAVLLQLRTPEEAAQSVLYTCVAPDDKIVPGGYYFNGKLREHGASPFVAPAADAACDWAARECKVPITRLNVRKVPTTKPTPGVGKKPESDIKS
jgi:NAD(P)-dependent dehydrogenase (short-subunit alcohol dehydrogenase family)